MHVARFGFAALKRLRNKIRQSTREVTMNDMTGKSAVAFNLRDTSGELHQLADYRGSWLLMVFHRHLG
jgi:hypothetical protein